MTFTEMVNTRESCRNFSDRAVEREKLEAVIRNARLSPSACNAQPWHFTVATGISAKNVAKCLQSMGMNKFTDRCPAFIVINQERENVTASLGKHVKGLDYADFDVGIVTAHLCYAAQEQGLATCIIGWLNEKKLKQVTGIKAGKKICLVVAVGYAAPGEVRIKKRKNYEDIVTFLGDKE